MSNETAVATPDTTKVAEAVDITTPTDNPNAVAEKIFDGNGIIEAVKKPETVPETVVKAEEVKKEEAKTDTITKYELKLMEGSALDPSAVERISSLAREKGLSQEAAQELLSVEDKAVTTFRDTQLKQHMEARKQWVESIKVDKEFGGEKFNENAEIAKRVIKEFADNDLIEALNVTGYGDNPALFKFVVKLGRKLQVLNDTYIKPGAPSTSKKEIHDIFYPSKE